VSAVKEQQAKSILSKVKHPQHWFGVEYNVNVYRGCSHGCVYCDSRSECYGIEDFENVTAKSNAPELLRRELSRKRNKAVIGTGSMSDPYIPAERGYKLTRQMLEAVEEFGFSVHITTKSDLVLRDLDLLTRINRKAKASIAFTVTTCDERLSGWAEPHAPAPASRLTAMRTLADNGLFTGVLLMPVLPFIMDDPAQIQTVAEQARLHGARYIIPWFGMSLRDRQRDYYYRKLDEWSPGLRAKYERTFGSRYTCSARHAQELQILLEKYCRSNGLLCHMSEVVLKPPVTGSEAVQLELF
jgi:DNA repair photolyase